MAEKQRLSRMLHIQGALRTAPSMAETMTSKELPFTVSVALMHQTGKSFAWSLTE